MLRIERMEVQGFKSFVEKVVIEFPHGITAVVGPNGCGKSNIADAMQWALGEQSARALRGARMEDVIFSGSDKRGPGGMAEVTLHLVTRDGSSLDDGRTRVSLTRRLYRTGDSEYLVDGARSRLTDIRQLLEQIRAGARTYAIIDQAHVASFVVSKPKERRLFIEEAAGIAGYKDRRRQADLKLEATRANLLRVDDILREVDRQRKQVQRQASLARRARRLDDELRALRTVWYRRRAQRLTIESEELSEVFAVAQRESAHLERERARLAELFGAARVQLEQAHSERAQAVDAAHRARLDEERLAREIEAGLTRAQLLEDEAGRQEGEEQRLEEHQQRSADEREHLVQGLALLVEQREAAAAVQLAAQQGADRERQKLKELQEAGAAAERELYEALHQRADASARLSAVREVVERETHRLAEAEAAGRKLEGQRDEAHSAAQHASESLTRSGAETDRLAIVVQTARAAEDAAQAALEAARAHEARTAAELGSRSGEKSALDSLDMRLAGADATRDVLERGVRSRGLVADLLSAPREFERAAESYLAPLLPTIVVDSDGEVRNAAALVPLGRVSFLPLDSPSVRAIAPTIPTELRQDHRVRGTLLGALSARGDHGAAVAHRLDDAVLVDTLDTALDLHRKFPAFSFLALDGHAVDSSGVVTLNGSGASTQDGLLARARRRDELASEVAVLEATLAAASALLAQSRDRLLLSGQERRHAEESLAESRRAFSTARLATEQAERELARLDREIGLAASMREMAQRAHDEAIGRTELLESQLGQLEHRVTALRSTLDARRAEIVQQEDAARASAEAFAGSTSELRALDERRLAMDRDRERIDRDLRDLDERRGRGQELRGQAMADAGVLRERAEQSKAEQDRLAAARALNEFQAQQHARHVDEVTARVREAERRVSMASELWEEARARRESAGLGAERARIEREHVFTDCYQAMGVSPQELPAELPAGDFEPVPWDDDTSLQDRIQQARDKRERVGPVNLLAEQEFTELNARFEELDGQKADLESTMEELRSSIKKMDRECRERFLDAFTSIRRYFREQFAILFRGGRADLVLEDEENPLEAGIEIICQPPGKKLQSVSLMSGGEKALAATAVLFAIFKFQPPPFCLLDEVDAPLDEANVGRFADAIRGFTEGTQFILITHNKRSMEMADLLYGVTMPEPGVSRLVSMTLD